MKWEYKSETFSGNLHAAASFISKYNPHWDIVTMSSSTGHNTIVVHRIPVKEEEPRRFATITWQVGDIEFLRPDWSKEQCVSFLKANESRLVNLLIPHGWAALEILVAESEAANAKA